MNGILYVQRNRQGKQVERPKGVPGNLVYQHGRAMLFNGDDITLILDKVSLDFINSEGVKLSGVEEITASRWIYQEWWFKVAE